jgi:hypothetical protein
MGIKVVRWLTVTNLGLVALQPLSAGLAMSGYGYASTAHSFGALALMLITLIQALTAGVLWWRSRVPASVAWFSIGLFAMVFLQNGFGRNRTYWLHVPVGVALVGLVAGQMSRLGGAAMPGR